MLNNPPLVPLAEIGAGILGRAATQTLYVSPNGSGAGGLTWAKAYTTIQDALNVASVDADDCTLIMISPHASYYDIGTTGDPTWAGNYILAGASRNWAKIRNVHASAASIMKFTGKVMLSKLNFNLGSGNGNGVILTHGGPRVRDCMFVGEDLTGAATALHLDGATTIKHGRLYGCDFVGHVAHMTGILLDNAARNAVEDSHIHHCLTAIQVVHENSDMNFFKEIDIGDCAVGLDLDAGNEQHFHNILFHRNVLNVDDEVGDHIWSEIKGAFPITVEPDNLTGVLLTADNVANVWGADTELRAAVNSTKPFRIVAEVVDPNIAQWYRLRLSADSGATFFDQVMVSVAKAAGSMAPSGTEHIFNKGTRISGSIKAESGGSDTMKVWLKLQEI